MAADVQPRPEIDVLPEFRNVFNEIFGDSDSDDDDFEGFEVDDLNRNNDYVDPMDENSWVVGGKAPTNFTFVPKVTEDYNQCVSYLDYFHLFVTTEILQTISNETNKYAKDYIESNKDNFKDHSRFKRFWSCSTWIFRNFS